MYSWKNIFSNYIELAKNQKRIGKFSWSQKPFNKKLYFELCFQLLKKMNRYKSRKPTRSILAKKEKGYQQYGTLLFTMLKTFDSFLYWNPILAKTQPWSRNLQTAMLCMTYQHTRREECVSQSRNTLWASHPTFRIDSTFPSFSLFITITILK